MDPASFHFSPIPVLTCISSSLSHENCYCDEGRAVGQLVRDLVQQNYRCFFVVQDDPSEVLD